MVDVGDMLPYDALPQSEKKRTNFCRCSCRQVFLTILGFVVLVPTISAAFGYFWLKIQVTRFTVDTPLHFPSTELEYKDLARVYYRVAKWKLQIDAGKTSEDLIITDEDLNSVIADSNSFPGDAFVTMTEGKGMADVSIPVPDWLPGGKGRFFIGRVFVEHSSDDNVVSGSITSPMVTNWDGPLASAMINVSLEDGAKRPRLIVTLKRADFFGYVLIGFVTDKIETEITKRLNKEAKVYKLAKTFSHINGVVIKQDEVIIVVDGSKVTSSDVVAPMVGAAPDVEKEASTPEV